MAQGRAVFRGGRCVLRVTFSALDAGVGSDGSGSTAFALSLLAQVKWASRATRAGRQRRHCRPDAHSPRRVRLVFQ